MKQHLFIVLPIIILMLFAHAANWLVEVPTYPVSRLHPFLIFASGIGALYCLTLGGVRKSFGLYASGLGFTFLTLAVALFPDLWLRWPEATLAGLAISQTGALLLPKNVVGSARLLTLAAMIIGLLSTIFLVLTVYLPWPAQARPYIAGVSVVILAFTASFAISARQRSFNAVAGATFLFWGTVTLTLLAALLYPPWNSAAARVAYEVLAFGGLLVIGAAHVLDLVQSERQLRSGRHMELETSMKDPLTNVANRRGLDVIGPNLIGQSRDAGRAVSVLMADIDHFKQINDIHGHQVGDTVLQLTASKFTSLVRKSDLVARYGGEEFVIILPGSPLAPALRLAERIRAAVEAELTKHDSVEISRTISIGVATAFPEEPTSLAELIKRADANLYRAKREGRNKVCADALPSDDF